MAVLVCLLLLLHFAASTDLLNKGSGLRNLNLSNPRQYTNKGTDKYGRRCPGTAPIEYLKTPNFEVMLLSEENSDPTWRTYSQFFQPKDLRNVQQIEQLHKPVIEQRLGLDMVDPVIDRILTLLDRDEQKMLDELSKTLEAYPAQYPNESPMYSSGYTTTRKRPNACSQYGSNRSRAPKKFQPQNPPKNLLIQDPCNEGYASLTQNQKKSIDSLNDLILRVVKVVTEST